MGFRRKLFLLLGGAYRLVCRVPLAGEPAARYFARAMGFAGSHVPKGLRQKDSMAELKRDLERVFEMTDMRIDEICQDETSIELVLSTCPYGFRRPEDALACDAAMDMDRMMFRYCGCDLTIEARLPHGDPVCRVVIKKKA